MVVEHSGVFCKASTLDCKCQAVGKDRTAGIHRLKALDKGQVVHKGHIVERMARKGHRDERMAHNLVRKLAADNTAMGTVGNLVASAFADNFHIERNYFHSADVIDFVRKVEAKVVEHSIVLDSRTSDLRSPSSFRRSDTERSIDRRLSIRKVHRTETGRN